MRREGLVLVSPTRGTVGCAFVNRSAVEGGWRVILTARTGGCRAWVTVWLVAVGTIS